MTAVNLTSATQSSRKPADAPTQVDEAQLRQDLAAAFRLAEYHDWHESIANHFSAAASEDGRTILLNPRWKHFSSIRASDLLKLHVDDPTVMERDDAPDPSAWSIHGGVHSTVPHARVLLHCHPTYATTLCTLEDPVIQPIDQVTARYYNRITYDNHFGGIATEASEGLRIAGVFGNHSVMMMGNHGVSVAAETVAEAFDNLYHLERAARTMVLAYSTGKPLKLMSPEMAESVALEWESYSDSAMAHFEEMKRVLDRTDTSWRD